MKHQSLTLQQIEDAISKSGREFQQKLLKDLPRLLHLKISDQALLKISEPSFDFWDNSDDDIYDQL